MLYSAERDSTGGGGGGGGDVTRARGGETHTDMILI